MNNLTDKHLLYLALIRSGVRKLQPLAKATGKGRSTVFFAINRLVNFGLVCKPGGQTSGALTLTEAGEAAVRDVALMRQNGGVRIGRVERV